MGHLEYSKTFFGSKLFWARTRGQNHKIYAWRTYAGPIPGVPHHQYVNDSQVPVNRKLNRYWFDPNKLPKYFSNLHKLNDVARQKERYYWNLASQADFCRPLKYLGPKNWRKFTKIDKTLQSTLERKFSHDLCFMTFQLHYRKWAKHFPESQKFEILLILGK